MYEPYMYEPYGTPQYPPDERWDSQLTYPLEGSYVRWPRASTPDRRQVRPGYMNDAPSVHVGPKLWYTIAAADAADAREAAKPHRVSGDLRHQIAAAYAADARYAAKPKYSSETPMPVPCLPSSLPLSSPSSPSPPTRPPPSPPRLPPVLEWEEIEREREDREEEYLRMEELDEQDGIGIARWQSACA